MTSVFGIGLNDVVLGLVGGTDYLFEGPPVVGVIGFQWGWDGH